MILESVESFAVMFTIDACLFLGNFSVGCSG